jgi:fido (protein-threonine AMPylation protein)
LKKLNDQAKTIEIAKGKNMDADENDCTVLDEPDVARRQANWDMAIGLQAVANLTVSDYLRKLAAANIRGEISLAEVRRLLDEYYAVKPDGQSKTMGMVKGKNMNNDYYGYHIVPDEPDFAGRKANWDMAIGLQAVDNLTVSDYLRELAAANIAGEISIEEAGRLLDEYYARKPGAKAEGGDRTEEADKVSQRIAKILFKMPFFLIRHMFRDIHRELFAGIFDHAGEIRTVDIRKRERILGGDSVYYADASIIHMTLEEDFEKEKSFDYGSLDERARVSHIGRFIADLWQLHPFREGNTRTTAVFLIKYLRCVRYAVNSDVFARHSKYFRDALVLANYRNPAKGYWPTLEYLDLFLGNAVFDEQNELKIGPAVAKT